MQARYLYSELARTIEAYRDCFKTGNQEWKDRHADWIEWMEKNLLPSGSGVDSGTRLVLDECHGEKLVLETAFHHMHESGMYDGWTEHKVTVTPSFAGGFRLRISGRNRNDIKEYLGDLFREALGSEISLEWYQFHYQGVPEIKSKWTEDETRQVWGFLEPDGTPNAFSTPWEARSALLAWCESRRTSLVVKEVK